MFVLDDTKAFSVEICQKYVYTQLKRIKTWFANTTPHGMWCII